jgi:hypothetical protein
MAQHSALLAFLLLIGWSPIQLAAAQPQWTLVTLQTAVITEREIQFSHESGGVPRPVHRAGQQLLRFQQVENINVRWSSGNEIRVALHNITCHMTYIT